MAEVSLARSAQDLVLARRIADLEYAYADCLDNDALEAWPNFFVDPCRYRVIPRENSEQGLPLAAIDCDNRDQLNDRVLILRNATVFSLRFYRHLITNIQFRELGDGAFQAHANCVIYTTDVQGGTTQMFSASHYRDEIVFDGEGARFREKLVYIDTYSVANHIAAPI